MAGEQDVKRGQQTAEIDEAGAASEVQSNTRFAATGQIPEVSAAGKAPAPTASELAFEQGPGVKALEALLATGTATPKQVVELIDTNRAESAAMFVLVESKLGSGFVTQVRDAMGLRANIKRRELVAGDPTGEHGGFFVASEKEQGARWRTGDGSFSGKANKDGLDSTWKMDGNDSLHAHTDKSGNGALGWEHDGKTVGELYKDKSEFGLRHNFALEGGTLGTGLRHRDQANEAFANYKSTDGRLTADAGLGIRDGGDSEHLAATYRTQSGDTLRGNVDHDVTGTRLGVGGSHKMSNGATLAGSGELAFRPEGTTGSVSGSYSKGTSSFDAGVARGLDQTSLHLGASERLNPNTTVSGSLDHVMKDHAGSQTTLHLAERYRTGNLIQSLDLEAGGGERNYLSGTAGVDARLGQNVYGGAFGGFRVEEGRQTGASLGASLTFTPHEKAALTLAGVLDQTGSLETRLQLDVFKSKIAGVGDIADHKKDALVSLFLSYSTGATNRGQLDERFGAPSTSTTPDPHVMAGIKIKF